jgi:FMN phosphatase YigB (HAD superfamily)
MKIAIVHYHLSPGGVTTVIRRASETLSSFSIPHVILSGSEINGLPARTIPDLAYRTDFNPTAAESLLDQLRQEASSALGAPPDVWHFHNHSLGKNALITEVVDRLVRDKERVVLQIHDLAEDGRPQNYHNIPDKSQLYPFSPRVRYAFINDRDKQSFIDSGLPSENAIRLSNPPPRLTPLPPPISKTPLLLYPSRAIRRKNLGELLLLALVAPVGTRFAITRAPENPESLTIHNRWRAFSEKLGLPIGFDVVDQDNPFSSWLAAATHLVTTSVSEGHGLVFDEAAALGRPLIGRNLGWTTSPDLYDRILIPKSWIEPKALDLHLTAAVSETHRLYERNMDDTESYDSLFNNELTDFGNLPEPLQSQILLHLVGNPSDDALIDSSGKLTPARSWIADRLENSKPQPLTPDATTATLVELYTSLANTPAGEVSHLDANAVLDRYLTPQSFHFLLTSPPRIRAVIFDIYGTLLISPSAGIKPDLSIDPVLDEMLRAAGFTPPPQITAALHAVVRRYHAASAEEHPEIDLEEVWQETLGVPAPPELIQAIEDRWHPVASMPQARETLEKLHASGLRLGLLSNAQFNTLPTLHRFIPEYLIDPALIVLSYQQRIAKPSTVLFRMIAARLAIEGIAPDEILYVGNDPLQDILPALRIGFRTALFTGHPDSLRPGDCQPDAIINSLSEIPALLQNL